MSKNLFLSQKIFSLPGEVFLNRNLNDTDKLVFMIIDMLDHSSKHCFASNEYIATKLHAHGVTISKSINKLIELQYIKRVDSQGKGRALTRDNSFYDRYRYLLDDFAQENITAAREEYKSNISLSDKLRQKEKDVKTVDEKTGEKRLYGDKVYEIIDYWNRQTDTIKHKNPNKRTYQKSEKKLNYLLQHGYTALDLKKAIKKYNQLLSESTTKFKTRRPYKVSMYLFLEFDKYTMDAMASKDREILNGVHSLFEECHTNSLEELFEKYSDLTTDKYPEITKFIKTQWLKYLREWITRRVEYKNLTGKIFPIDIENLCRNISIRLHDFWEDNNKNFISGSGIKDDPKKFIKLMFSLPCFESSKIKLVYLNSDKFLEGVIRENLVETGYMKEDNSTGTKPKFTWEE